MKAAPASADKGGARSPPSGPGRASATPAHAAPAELGNLAIQNLLRAGAIQAKLTVGSPDDPLEREADKVADRVMRSAEETPIQRKCEACAAGGPCPKCEAEEKLRAKEIAGRTPRANASADSSIASLRGGGQPLPRALRAFFEPRMGADFSGVRVHTDSRAQKIARSIDARAFTIGRDMVFGGGEYSPHTPEGKRLLAHELTHVAQQGAADPLKAETAPPNAPRPAQRLQAGVVQRQVGLWGTRPDLPKTPPTPIDMTARVASLKDPAKMELNLTTAYIHRGKDGMLGFIAGIEQELDQYSPKDKPDVLAVIEPIRDRILVYHDRYVVTFESNMRGTVNDLLTASQHALDDEKKKYGLGKDGDKYSVKATKDTGDLTKAAQHLQDVGTVLVNKEIEFQNDYRKKHPRGPGQDAQAATESQNAMLSNPEFVLRIQEYEQLFKTYSARFPILAAFKDNPYGLAAVAAMGRSQKAATVVGEALQEKQDDIDKTRANLDGGKLKTWSLPNIVSGTKARLKVKAESLENKFVDDTVAEIKADEEMRQKALMALTIAVGVITAVATAGGSLVLAAGATGFGLGLSAGQAVLDLQNYRVQSAASNTALDRAQSISQDDPSLFWLAMDIALVIADLGQCAAIFKGAGGPIRKFLTLRRGMEAAHAVDKAGAALTAEEVARLDKVLTDEVVPALGGLPNETKTKIRGDLDPLGKLPATVRGTTAGAKWTIKELETVLKRTAGGLEALGTESRYGVTIVYSSGGRTFFDAGTNTIFIADNLSNEEAALAYIHEMTHARYQHQGLTASLAGAGRTISRSEYVEKMCREEAEAVGNEIAHKFEYQAKSGVAYRGSTAAERAYSDAAAAESRSILAANPAADPGIVQMRSRIAGREALYQEFMAGRITNSVDGRTYTAYYGALYDAQPLPSFPHTP